MNLRGYAWCSSILGGATWLPDEAEEDKMQAVLFFFSWLKIFVSSGQTDVVQAKSNFFFTCYIFIFPLPNHNDTNRRHTNGMGHVSLWLLKQTSFHEH